MSGQVESGTIESNADQSGAEASEKPEPGVSDLQTPEGVTKNTEEEEEEVEEEGGEEEGEELTPEELLATGKKCLAAGDATSAVENFQEACSILAEVHGQVSRELAEPYYLYGRALLELAREKSAMFGKGIPVNEGGQNGLSGEASSADTANSAVASGDSSGEGSAVTQEEEEESDLQLSWEVLELARVICQREQGNEYKLKLSDVNLALGEVGLESDQYEQAIADLQSCLRLREFTLEPTDRRIAEVHFSLGLAHTLAKQADEAIQAYKSSRSLLLKRKDNLEGEMKDTPQENFKQEIQELEQLIPDINAKIADVEELKKILKEREEQENAPEESIGFDPPSSTTSSKLPISDISHLVRKRVVPDTVSENKEAEAKRLCTEDPETEPTATDAHVHSCNSTSDAEQ